MVADVMGSQAEPDVAHLNRNVSRKILLKVVTKAGLCNALAP